MRNFLESNQIKKLLRKILKYFGIFMVYCLIAYNIIFMFNEVFAKRKYVKIFGLYISTEKENSMSPAIRRNSLIIGVKTKNIKNDDIIGYDIDGSLKYHRLIKKSNQNLYITKADKNYNYDFEEKSVDQIKAKKVLVIPVIGWLFRMFESKVITIFIIIALLLKYSYNNYKIEMNKKRKEKKNRFS